jgi:hypothetical protein
MLKLLNRRQAVMHLVSVGFGLGATAIVPGGSRVAAEEQASPFASNETGRIVSACARCRVNTRSSETNHNRAVTYRSRHKTNAAVDGLQLEYWNGFVLNTGVGGYLEQSPERAAAPAILRAAVLVDIDGARANQAGARVFPVTWLGMSEDAAFVRLGGMVLENGRAIHVPEGAIVRCDPIADLVLAAGQPYFVQTEDYREPATLRPISFRMRSDLGDAALFRANPSEAFLETDWSDAYSGEGGIFSPTFIWGQSVEENVALILVDGDSIISENSDVGDADGALGFGKRALNMLGLSYIDLSVPGSNMRYVLEHDAYAVRRHWVQLADFIITNHANNDLGESTFETDGRRAGFRQVVERHVAYLRDAAKPGVPILRTTPNPRTRSTDEWATLSGQTARAEDDVWPTGTRWQWRDYAMGLNAYDGLKAGTEIGDIIFDYYAALGGQDGLWPVGDSGEPEWSTVDGTHPSERAHIWVADAFADALRSYFEGRPHALINDLGPTPATGG